MIILGGMYMLNTQKYITSKELSTIDANSKILHLDHLPFENGKENKIVNFSSKVNFDKFVSKQKNYPIQFVFYKNTCPYCNAGLPVVYKYDKNNTAYYININKADNKEVLLSLANKEEIKASTIVRYVSEGKKEVFDYTLKQEKPEANEKNIALAFEK